MANLPYVTATGNIGRALDGIVSAATPERVSQDFVKTILNVPGGSGDQMTSFLKKVGFANSDGSPSSIYKSFRNFTSRGIAAADSLKFGYGPLYVRNEFMHKLSDDALRGLIIEETGLGDESAVPNLVLSSIKAIRKHADFSSSQANISQPMEAASPVKIVPIAPHQDNLPQPSVGQRYGMNLAYTINLNLPATSDIAVFNAIFKSLSARLIIRVWQYGGSFA